MSIFLPSSLHAAAGLRPLIITSLYVPPTVHRFSTSLPENEMKRAPAALFIIFHPRIHPSCGDATTYSSDSSSQRGSLQTPDQGEAAEFFLKTLLISRRFEGSRLTERQQIIARVHVTRAKTKPDSYSGASYFRLTSSREATE